MVIFVHGTLKPAKYSLSIVSAVMHNKIKNSLYEKMIYYLRKNQYLYQNQAMQGLGLMPIDTLHNESKIGAHCIKHLFDRQYDFYNTLPLLRRYYTFGWNGLLNAHKRLKEGENFYTALEKEVANLRTQGLEPIIHINAYSHGGSVALNLAAAKIEKQKTPSFSIDQLVLLATPVQRETDYLAGDTDFFKKIFHLYSTEDNVQTYDVFSTRKEFFSRSTFTARHRFQLPKNLTQVRIRLTQKVRRLPTHVDPALLDDAYTLLASKGTKFSHKDPGHSEFWNLCWEGDSWYRKTLPIYPLPVVALVPTIVHLLNEYAPHASCVSFDYCPSLAGARIITCHTKKSTAVPFLTKEFVTEMQHKIMTCMPDGYTLEERRTQEQEALTQAHEELETNKYLKQTSRQKLMTSYLSLSRKIGSDLFPNL